MIIFPSQRARYSAASNGGMVFRDHFTDNNGQAGQQSVWTKPTSRADSVSAVGKPAEVRSNALAGIKKPQ